MRLKSVRTVGLTLFSIPVKVPIDYTIASIHIGNHAEGKYGTQDIYTLRFLIMIICMLILVFI